MWNTVKLSDRRECSSAVVLISCESHPPLAQFSDRDVPRLHRARCRVVIAILS